MKRRKKGVPFVVCVFICRTYKARRSDLIVVDSNASKTATHQQSQPTTSTPSPVTTPPTIHAASDSEQRLSPPQSQIQGYYNPRRESRAGKRHQLMITVENPEKGANGVRFYVINVGTDIPKYSSVIGADTWTVRRRYNHFRALFENISTIRDIGVRILISLPFWPTGVVQFSRACILVH